jgi:hypothetical protein
LFAEASQPSKIDLGDYDASLEEITVPPGQVLVFEKLAVLVLESHTG